MGIVEEGSRAMETFEGPVLDAALIAGAQKVEHYEIASYGTLAYFADLLENDRAKELLGATLDEEKAADQKLNTIAKSRVNREALLAGDASEDEPSSGFGIPETIRSAAASMGLAQDRRPSSRKSSARGRSMTRRRR
jgi:hypothetical protein